MRTGLLALGIVACLGLALGLALVSDRALSAALSEEARLAIDVGCRGRSGHLERECRSMLTRLYLAGSLDPDKTLRAWCDEVRTGRWGGSWPPAPEVCVERYGGWREG